MRLAASLAALAMATALGLSAARAAPVSYTDTHLYGSRPGRIDPEGTDTLGRKFVRIADNSLVRFRDSFDFSGFAYTTISSITLTLDFARATSRSESWAVRVPGSDDGALTDDYSGPLAGLLSPASYVLTIASDTLGGDAFATALGSGSLAFLFSESTRKIDTFRLRSARIDILGDLSAARLSAAAAVPLPAAGLLLVAGLGGLAALRRRRRA